MKLKARQIASQGKLHSHHSGRYYTLDAVTANPEVRWPSESLHADYLSNEGPICGVSSSSTSHFGYERYYTSTVVCYVECVGFLSIFFKGIFVYWP